MIRDLDLVSRWASEAAWLGGGRLFNFSLRVARSQAWGTAERLYPLSEPRRRQYLSELDELVSVVAYLIPRDRGGPWERPCGSAAVSNSGSPEP